MLFRQTHPKYILSVRSLEDTAEEWFWDGPSENERTFCLALVVSKRTADLKSV